MTERSRGEAPPRSPRSGSRTGGETQVEWADGDPTDGRDAHLAPESASPEGPSPAEVLAAERPRLIGLAYRMTGSRLDAEDIVQEAWFRAQRADWSAIDRPKAWLNTVVSRLALDSLKSAQRRRETYVGPWLPEPVVTTGQSAIAAGTAGGPRREDPAATTELAETLTFGFLRVLEQLSPVERVVFILADVFDTPYQEIAATVDRTPEACRQIASRARRKVRTGQDEHDSLPEAAKVAYDLAVALASGQVDQVLALLAEDAVLVSDGGSEHRAARRPVVGADRVSRLLVNLAARQEYADSDYQLTTVNNEPGAVVWIGGELLMAVTLGVHEGLVREVYIVNNPDKLAALDLDTPVL